MRFAFDLPSSSFGSALNADNRQRRASRSLLNKAVRATAKGLIETLEARRLMASVAGGQIGVFQGPDGLPVRINVTGTGSLDFIGGTLSAFGAARMNDIPMTIFDTDGNVIRENLGGYGGRRGFAPVEQVLGDNNGDSRFDGNQSPYGGGGGNVNFDGLAATNTGTLYGVNRYSIIAGQPNVDIVRIDSKSGNVSVEREVSGRMLEKLQEINPFIELNDIRDIIGADFSNEAQNQLRFAVNINFPIPTGNGEFDDVIVPALFTYNLNTKRVTGLDQALFGWTGTEEDERTIDDFTFLDNGTVAIFGRLTDGDSGLFFSDPDSVVMDNFVPVTIGPEGPDGEDPEPLESIAAIEAIPGEDYFIAISGTGNDGEPLNDGESEGAEVLRIPITGGRGESIGAAVDPDADDDVDTKLGETLRDLAWQPRAVDQFFQPGKRGVLLGGDSFYDTLLAYDIRERFENTDLYAIFGDDVRPDTSVAVAEFEIDDDDDLPFNRRLYLGLMNPFGGDAGSIFTNMTTGEPRAFDLGETGGLYLGLRTADPDDALTVPVLGLDSRTQFLGGRPGVTLPKVVRPGVYLNGTITDFFFGGTITGSVNINGSVDTFYAGNILTGDPLSGSTNPNDNFFVNGDLRKLSVRGGIGMLESANDDLFHPRTDFLINGRVQQIQSGGEFRAALDVAGKTSEQTIGAALRELEFTPNLNDEDREALAFEGRYSGRYELVDGLTRNDTFDTPQILGSYFSKNRKRGGQATLNGIINNGTDFNDQDDYYGVPLLAGQSIQVSVGSTDGIGALGGLGVTLSIIDPDGRIYARDLSNQNEDAFLNQTLQVTADKPGLWRLLVSAYTPGQFTRTLVNADRPYALTVDKIGEVAIGGVKSAAGVYFDRADLGIRARSADIGAILAGDRVRAGGSIGAPGRDTQVLNVIEATNGNIRSVEGSGIGDFDDPANSLGLIPTLRAPRGSVGLIRGTDYVYFNVYDTTLTGGEPTRATVIGGDLQTVESDGDIAANIVVNGSIGNIRGESWGNGPADDILINPFLTNAGIIAINQDENGTAELGLLDFSGNFGTFQFGGPILRSGEGGNIRYMRVGGDVYRSPGTGTGGVTTRTGVDQAVEVVDDSGATITLTPFDGVAVRSSVTPGSSNNSNGIPDPFGGNGPGATSPNGIPDPFGGNSTPGTSNGIPDPFGGANNPSTITRPSPDDIVGTITVSAYPVDGGGAVIYDVLTDTGLAIAVENGTGDLGVIRKAAGLIAPDPFNPRTPNNGAPIVNPVSPQDEQRFNPSRLQPLATGTGTSLDIVAQGSRANIFEITSESGAGTVNFTRIVNNTDGEIVNITAGDVSYLSGDYVGISRPVANTKIEPLADVTDARFAGVANAQPFIQQRTGIFINNSLDIRSRGPLGNIVAAGVIQNLEANSDRQNTRGVNEGIVAPVIVTGATSSIRNVDIGEGLASTGSGNVGFAGLFSQNTLGLITNENGGGDLRGDVIASTYLEGITLTGGASLLDADILQLASGTDVEGGTFFGPATAGDEDFALAIDLVAPPTNNSLLFGMGDIRISGNGGIINSRIVGYNMGRIVTDKNSFGMVTSSVISSSGATMAGTNIGGLGIRQSQYSGGSDIGDVKADGDGKVLDIRNFSTSVRGSESVFFDSMTGIKPNVVNDLNLFLGTSKKLTKIDGVTNSGVIQDSEIVSARSIDLVSAYEFRGVNTGGSRPRETLYPMRIFASQEIGSVVAKRNINGLRIQGAQVGNVSAGRDITQFQLNSNNRVKALKAGRNILGTANFNLVNNGSLDLLQAGGNINGTGFAAKGIRSIVVGGNLGSARSQGGIRSGADINLLQVAGNISGTALIRANKLIKTLILNGNLEENATVRATSFGTQKIDGTVFGQIQRG